MYLALRFGHFQTAIVDKDLGILESLAYSSKITEGGNRVNLLGLGIVCFFVISAGLLALLVGVFAAIPVVFPVNLVAYRWLQYGRAAALEQAGGF